MKFVKFTEYLEKLEKTTKRLEMFEILSQLFQEAKKDEVKQIVYFCEEQLLPPFYTLEMHMAESSAAKAIAAISKKSKEEVIKLYKELGDFGLVAEKLNKKSKKDLTINEVYNKLTVMAKEEGKGSVEKKINLLTELLSHCNSKEAKYVSRFVLGRLRLGVGDPTIMDSMSKAITGDRTKLRKDIERAYNLGSDLGIVAETLFSKGEAAIRKFKVHVGSPIRMAAAERLPGPEEIIKKIGKCAVESKYDGFRLQVHKNSDKIEIFSRNLEKMTHMFPDIVSGIKKQINAKTAIFEGEALAFDESSRELLPFQVTIQRKRKHQVLEMSKDLPLVMFLFDILYKNGEDLTGLGYERRRKIMSQTRKDGPTIKLSNRIITDNSKEMEDFFEEEIAKGLEGIMAKKLDGIYEAGGRGFNWIKMKRSYKGQLEDTIDVVIIGYFKGRGQRTKFGIGALLAAIYDKKKDAFTSIARIGSGLTEENWVKIRKELDKGRVLKKPTRVESMVIPDVWVTPKHVLTVLADEITESPMHMAAKDGDGPGLALRFPRVQGWIRQDKKPEDATSTKEVKGMFKQQRKVKAMSFGR